MGSIDIGNELIDLGLLVMNKQKEDNDFVWYKFETTLTFKNLYAYDEKGRKYRKSKKIHGIFRFRKKGPLEDESFKVIEEDTDPVFLGNQRVRNRLCYIIYVTMKKHHKYNKYPEITSWHC